MTGLVKMKFCLYEPSTDCSFLIDTDKYSALNGLVQRIAISNPEVQDINKALTDPEPVVANVASFNGQKCFAYKGKCVDLNDNNAMSQACGSGFTVVGWDHAGCGKKSCVNCEELYMQYLKLS